MKKYFAMIVLALCSFSAFAQWFPPMPVFANVYNNGTFVQVSASNPNNTSVWCSGSVSMNMDDGTNSNEFVNMSIFPHGYDSRNLYPMGGAHIRNVNHNIYCR